MAGASGEVLWIGLTQISVGIRGEMVSCKNQVEPRKQTSLFGGVAKWPKMLVHDINIRWFESNRLLRGIDLAEFKNQTDYDALQLFAEPIRRYRKLGLIEKDSGRVSLTRQALGIADSILCDFAIV